MRVNVTKELDKQHWIMNIHVQIETEDGERQKLKEFGELFDKFQEDAYKLSSSKLWENQNDIS